MFYLVKSPWWLQRIYHECLWQMPGGAKKIYLTFDDGPHPVATSFVLEQLAKYQAKATFFCIGKNVDAFPFLYEEIIEKGHAVGNHTQHHLNGWKTNDAVYMEDISAAKKIIDSSLFRPPYGRASKFQLQLIKKMGLTPVMWTVLSGDFDPKLSPQRCLENVLFNAGDGSVIVFHDSEKAFDKLEYVLPRVLEHFSARGFQFAQITG